MSWSEERQYFTWGVRDAAPLSPPSPTSPTSTSLPIGQVEVRIWALRRRWGEEGGGRVSTSKIP
ncbi:hypothetical protein E2C01_097013 [Portunus trituberculatus]|uniref:Uncharacterized protein n=1 Tax=Portunus trituberculatus TaxID=210409 RepID=A0A5B7JX58_PORTR|nr:hypothetical protein [Portunus trituberculatus]